MFSVFLSVHRGVPVRCQVRGGGGYPSPIFGGTFFCTESQPESVPEVNPEAGGVGGTPIAVTQEDFLVNIAVCDFM